MRAVAGAVLAARGRCDLVDTDGRTAAGSLDRSVTMYWPGTGSVVGCTCHTPACALVASAKAVVAPAVLPAAASNGSTANAGKCRHTRRSRVMSAYHLPRCFAA